MPLSVARCWTSAPTTKRTALSASTNPLRTGQTFTITFQNASLNFFSPTRLTWPGCFPFSTTVAACAWSLQSTLTRLLCKEDSFWAPCRTSAICSCSVSSFSGSSIIICSGGVQVAPKRSSNFGSGMRNLRHAEGHPVHGNVAYKDGR